MAEANHLLVVFLAVEMASVPSYTLAGHSQRKSQKQRSFNEIRGLRCRCGRCDALWNESDCRHHRLGAHPDDRLADSLRELARIIS